MQVEITQTDSRKIWVNGKLVARDMNGEWVTTDELHPSESTKLHAYLTENKLLND